MTDVATPISWGATDRRPPTAAPSPTKWPPTAPVPRHTAGTLVSRVVRHDGMAPNNPPGRLQGAVHRPAARDGSAGLRADCVLSEEVVYPNPRRPMRPGVAQ